MPASTPIEALLLLAEVAARFRSVPLIAVVQWQAIQDDRIGTPFLQSLAKAGAAALLPVGVPLWQCAALSARAEEHGLQTVFACPSDASPKYRDLSLRFCTGCLYVPRGRVTGAAPVATNTSDFCRAVAAETDLPMIVGVGVNSAADVAEDFATPAKAAAVGSAAGRPLHAGRRGRSVYQPATEPLRAPLAATRGVDSIGTNSRF